MTPGSESVPRAATNPAIGMNTSDGSGGKTVSMNVSIKMPA
jgi:hypothetical protein